MKIKILTILLCVISFISKANGELVNLSGQVTEEESGQPLINAHIMANGILMAVKVL